MLGGSMLGADAARAGEPVQPAEAKCAAGVPSFLNGAPLARTAARLARGDKVRVLAIGSSTTAGVGATSAGDAYPSVFEEKFERKLEKRLPGTDLVLTVAGASGETAGATRARLEARLAEAARLGEPIDLVIWQVGTNDGAAPPADGDEKRFRREVRQGIVAARAVGADVVLIDPQFYPAVEGDARYERFVSIVHEAGFARGASVVARYAVMRAWARDGAERLTAKLAPDAFHMNDLGHACTAAMLADGIAALATEAAEQMRRELSDAVPAPNAAPSAAAEPAADPSRMAAGPAPSSRPGPAPALVP